MERVTHPGFARAQVQLRYLKRYVPNAGRRDLKRYRAEFAHHAQECNDERQAVLMVTDLIEQNRPLSW